jgi:hypothetical protein
MQAGFPFMPPFILPSMFFTMMMRVLMIIIMSQVPMAFGKSKGNRCWCNYRAQVTVTAVSIVVMDDASLKNETHQKQEQDGNSC